MATWTRQMPPAAPLAFGAGDDGFRLRIKRLSALDRTALIDAACTDSFTAIQAAVEEVVEDWEGVVDERGRPVPFWGHEPILDAEGAPIVDEHQEPKTRRVKQLGKFLGGQPLAVQVDVMAGVLAYAGLPSLIVENLREVIGRKLRIAVRPDPTPPPEEPPPTPT